MQRILRIFADRGIDLNVRNDGNQSRIDELLQPLPHTPVPLGSKGHLREDVPRSPDRQRAKIVKIAVGTGRDIALAARDQPHALRQRELLQRPLSYLKKLSDTLVAPVIMRRRHNGIHPLLSEHLKQRLRLFFIPRAVIDTG